MIRLLAALALAATPVATFAQAPQLTLEQRMLLRCSAAFALVANRQESGQAGAGAYPAMAKRGQEFFVRASARVMDETGLDRAGIRAALSAEAQDLVETDTLDEVMQVCLPLLVQE